MYLVEVYAIQKDAAVGDVVKSAEHIYDHCYKIDCGAAKGALYAKIDKLGKPYHIFATHFQAATEDFHSNTR